jgi:hypothetical protein
VIPLNNTRTTFFYSINVADVIGFQVKDIAYDSAFIPATPRIWIESENLAAISGTVGARFGNDYRNIIASFALNPTISSASVQPYFKTNGPSRFNQLDFNVYKEDGTPLIILPANKCSVTIEFCHVPACHNLY